MSPELIAVGIIVFMCFSIPIIALISLWRDRRDERLREEYLNSVQYQNSNQWD